MAAVETLPPMNGKHDVEMHDAPKDNSSRFATGLILPPPEIKSVIDRTATFVARSANPPQFEDKIREGQRSDPKFSFLNPLDPYHAYYRHKLEKVASGEFENEAAPKAAGQAETETAKEPVDVGAEPPTPQFILDLPNISGIDLDIMKLTALFTARRGRAFLAALSEKEGRNYQFDFLRPTHSLFVCFNRLVEQYTKILHPDKARLEELKERTVEGARWKMLEQARKYGKWEKSRREREKRREDDQEAERLAFAEIDWHDYAIVQTIEFTAVDANSELPPPMSVQEVENMTLAQKRMAAMIMENTAEDIEAHKAKQAAADATSATAAHDDDGDAVMEESDDEGDAAAKAKQDEEARQREIARAQAMQAMPSTAGPMKIRTDYVPKLGAKNAKSALTTCTICGQQIPVDELQEHMRIELLDPKWKEQRDALEARKAQASELQRGANVVSSLKNLARTRVDIFGSETDEQRRKREEEEERLQRREREKVVWDGHTASKANTLDKFSTNVNFEEQIAAIHRAKGLGPQDANAIGPGIGPAAVPPPLTSVASGSASLPAPPRPVAASRAFAAATVSSGPQPASAYNPPPVMLPPLRYQGLQPQPQFGGYQAPAGYGQPPVQAGVVRSAEDMDASDMPPSKRQRVAKLPGGALYPEEDWISMHPHPISLKVQLPNEASKPELKFDGSTITIQDLPLTLYVSTLRDRILSATGSSVGVSKMRLLHGGKLLTNSSTIASYNLEDEDLVVLDVKLDQRKK